MDAERISTMAMAALFWLSSATFGEAAERQRGRESGDARERFLQATSTGDVLWASAPRQGRAHLDGGLALYTGDYFRGRYGGVPAALDRLSYRLRLGVSVDMLEGGDRASVEALSFSAGTVNALTDTPVPDEDIWYTSDRYIGLAAAFGPDLLAGLTYTAYANPFSPPGTPREIAIALRHTGEGALGSLQPQAKAALTVGPGSGWLVQASITPSFQPFEAVPVTITSPIAFGAGFDGYYGADVEEGYYAEIGLVGSVPVLGSAPGRWAASAGAYLTLRSDAILEAAPRLDDAGNAVVVGFLALTFTF